MWLKKKEKKKVILVNVGDAKTPNSQEWDVAHR